MEGSIEEVCVQSITARSRKSTVLFGIGLILFIVATISVGMYAANRTGAEQSITTVSTPNETDTSIEVKVDNGLVEPESITSIMELDNTTLSDTQQSEPAQVNPGVEVRVDGTAIEVPEEGTVHKEIVTEDGSTNIDISTQSNTSSGDSRTRSSINIDVDSSTRIRSQTEE